MHGFPITFVIIIRGVNYVMTCENVKPVSMVLQSHCLRIFKPKLLLTSVGR